MHPENHGRQDAVLEVIDPADLLRAELVSRSLDLGQQRVSGRDLFYAALQRGPGVFPGQGQEPGFITSLGGHCKAHRRALLLEPRDERHARLDLGLDAARLLGR